MRTILSILFTLLIFSGIASNELDSLKQAGRDLQGTDKIKNLINISRQYFIEEDTTGIQYGKEAVALARKSDYPQGVGMAKLFLGLLYEFNDPETAVKYFKESSDTLMALNHFWAGFGYENAARIYEATGWYPEALDMSLKALNAYEITGDTVQLAKTMSIVGYINDLIGNHREAINWQKKALKLIAIKNSKEIEGLAIGRMGISYDELGIYDSATFYNQRAVEIFKDINDKYYIAQWLSNIGNTQLKQGNIASAEDYFLSAYKVSHQSKEVTLILINLGKVYLETNRFKAADDTLDVAIQKAIEWDQKEFLSEAYFRKYELFEKQEKPDKALKYYILYSSLKDSILNEKKTQQLADMQVRYDTEQKEKLLLATKAEKERLAKEKALTEIKVYNRNKWIIGISTLSIIVILSVFALNQRKRRKIQAEKDAAVIEEREKGIKAVFDAQEEERQRIAKDLHDGVGQQVSAVKLHLQNVTDAVSEKIPSLQPDLDKITKMLSDTGSEIRSISHQMMPRALTELGLVAALEDMIGKSFTYSEIACKFEHHGLKERLPSHVEIGLYRIAQELVNNILKHSGADTVDIQLMKTDYHCILIVHDNGKGLAPTQKVKGIGMLNIDNRLRTLNGVFNMESATGSGTTATIRIALPRENLSQ